MSKTIFPLAALALAVAVLALVVAVLAAYRAGRQAGPRPGALDEADFMKRLRAAEKGGPGHHFYRASEAPGDNALVVCREPAGPEAARALRTNPGEPGWRGVFWVRRLRADDDQEAWRKRLEEWGGMCFVRSGLVFFGDVDEARRCCDLAGI